MTTKKNITQPQTRKQLIGSLAPTIAASVVLAVAVLVPFAIRSHSSYFSVASPAPTGGHVTYYMGNGAGMVSTSQSASIGWQTPSAIAAVSFAGLAVLVVIGLVTLTRGRGKKFRQQQRTSKMQLIVATIAVALTASAYGIMRASSQASPLPIRAGQPYALTGAANRAGCAAVLFSSPNSSSVESKQCGHASVAPQRPLGYGIAPAYVVLDSAICLLAPLLMWFRFALNPRYVAGQKKDDLFQ